PGCTVDRRLRDSRGCGVCLVRGTFARAPFNGLSCRGADLSLDIPVDDPRAEGKVLVDRAGGQPADRVRRRPCELRAMRDRPVANPATSVVLILCAVVLSTAAQIIVKISLNDHGPIPIHGNDLVRYLIEIVRDP